MHTSTTTFSVLAVAVMASAQNPDPRICLSNLPGNTANMGSQYSIPYTAPNMNMPVNVELLTGCPSNCVSSTQPIEHGESGNYNFRPAQAGSGYGFKITQQVDGKEIFNWSHDFAITAATTFADSPVTVPSNCKASNSSSAVPGPATPSVKTSVSASVSSVVVSAMVSSLPYLSGTSVASSYVASVAPSASLPVMPTTTSTGSPSTHHPSAPASVVSQIADNQPQAPAPLPPSYKPSAPVVSPSTSKPTTSAAPPTYIAPAAPSNVYSGTYSMTSYATAPATSAPTSHSYTKTTPSEVYHTPPTTPTGASGSAPTTYTGAAAKPMFGTGLAGALVGVAAVFALL